MTVTSRVHRIAASDGCRIAASTFELAGSARPWLTFSNSLLTNRSLWADQVQAVLPHANVLTYDQRGHGDSDAQAPFAFTQLASDVLAVWDALGIAKSHLVGISMGASTLAHVAAQWPQRCGALVYADSAPHPVPNQQQMWAERVALVRTHGLDALVPPTLDRWFPPAAVRGRELARPMMKTTSVDGFVGCAQALGTLDVAPALAQLQGPVLLLVGEKDGVLPGLLRAQADRRAGWRYEEIPGAGHLSNLDDPQRFSAAVLSVLE